MFLEVPRFARAAWRTVTAILFVIVAANPLRAQAPGGFVVSAGDSPATITGRVGGNGAVTVTVSYGNQRATGSGRLAGNGGGGSWSGGDCSGRWEAERRGA